jgi:cell pole-organizing protein PopZ
MEDILASIRRILSEEEPAEPARPDPAPRSGDTPPPDEDVLVLDPSMMVPESEAEAEQPPAEPDPPTPPPPSPPVQAAEPPSKPPELVAPAAAAAAASSVESLVRTLVAERATQTHRGGPTIEDLVREEIRPLLKDWLDNHLPPLVERLVRSEIERVVGRAVP